MSIDWISMEECGGFPQLWFGMRDGIKLSEFSKRILKFTIIYILVTFIIKAIHNTLETTN